MITSASVLVSWHAAEYLIGSAFAARQELANVVFLPTGFTGKLKNVLFGSILESNI